MSIQELMLEGTTLRLSRLFDAYPGVAMTGGSGRTEAAKGQIELRAGEMEMPVGATVV